MKILNTALIYVLLIAVAALFYLHFASLSGQAPVVKKTESLSSLPIAFVNLDSIYEKYTFCVDLRKDFTAKQEKSEADMQNRFKALEREIVDYQQKGAAMTDAQREATEKKLMQKEQGLREYRTELHEKLEKEDAEIRKKIYEKITSHLQEFAKKNQFKYILAQGQGSTILYGESGLDVTETVLQALNESYKSEK